MQSLPPIQNPALFFFVPVIGIDREYPVQRCQERDAQFRPERPYGARFVFGRLTQEFDTDERKKSRVDFGWDWAEFPFMPVQANVQFWLRLLKKSGPSNFAQLLFV